MKKMSLDNRIESMMQRFSPRDLAFFNIAEQEIENAPTIKLKIESILNLMSNYKTLNNIVFEFYLKGDDQKIRCVEITGKNLGGKTKFIGKSITSGIIPKVLEYGKTIEATVDDESGRRKDFAESNNLIKSRYYSINGTAVLVVNKRDYTSVFSKKQLDIIKYSKDVLLNMTLLSDIKYKKLLDLATKDGLTGLYNRRHFEERLEQSVNFYKRINKGSLSLILVDIDYFKSVNDTYGHKNGDKVLVDVANTIKNQVRDYDIVARYGGEEIAVILESTSKRKAISFARRISNAVKEYGILHPEYSVKTKEGKLWRTSVSIGVASMPNDAYEKEKLFEIADRSLYLSKETGRARVSWYDK